MRNESRSRRIEGLPTRLHVHASDDRNAIDDWLGAAVFAGNRRSAFVRCTCVLRWNWLPFLVGRRSTIDMFTLFRRSIRPSDLASFAK